MAKNRLDLLLVEFGLVKSRRLAQDLIAEGSVKVLSPHGEWVLADKSSQIFELTADSVSIQASNLTQFVSRGGIKLKGAIDHIGLSVHGLSALDIGISKGGFTDCLLQRGAARVVGIDVGHGQVDQKIWADPRVQVFEGVHILEFNPHELGADIGWDLVVVDLSFIPLSKCLPKIKSLMRFGSELLALVKPQFEVGPENLNRQGIVIDERLFGKVQTNIESLCRQLGFGVIDYFPSELRGQDGNQEFFLYARKDEY